jgi:L-ribulose-5-phosphate 3-epimerase
MARPAKPAHKEVRLGYNTNGLAFHGWDDALALIAEAGYRSVALTIDHGCLNPYDSRYADECARMQRTLKKLRLSSVIETGARFLLNPRLKHEPTLLSPRIEERALRIDFLRRCIDLARELGSDAVSFWSGAPRDEADIEAAWQRLVDGCRQVTDYASQKNVRLAFEPEPDMLVERMDQFERLVQSVDAPQFGLTFDIGHAHCVGDGPIASLVRRFRDRLYNVHIEDMRRGVHDHLRFGEGEIDFPPILSALEEIGYPGGVHVELSRHSHMAPDVLRESFEFLNSLLARIRAE